MAEQAETAAEISRAELEVNEPSEHGTSQHSSVCHTVPDNAEQWYWVCSYSLACKEAEKTPLIDQQRKKA